MGIQPAKAHPETYKCSCQRSDRAKPLGVEFGMLFNEQLGYYTEE